MSCSIGNDQMVAVKRQICGGDDVYYFCIVLVGAHYRYYLMIIHFL